MFGSITSVSIQVKKRKTAERPRIVLDEIPRSRRRWLYREGFFVKPDRRFVIVDVFGGLAHCQSSGRFVFRVSLKRHYLAKVFHRLVALLGPGVEASHLP